MEERGTPTAPSRQGRVCVAEVDFFDRYTSGVSTRVVEVDQDGHPSSPGCLFDEINTPQPLTHRSFIVRYKDTIGNHRYAALCTCASAANDTSPDHYERVHSNGISVSVECGNTNSLGIRLAPCTGWWLWPRW